jgi:DNA-binding transcriptional LysR family regulator
MLRKVEDEVGAELFHRTGRGVEPTHAGLAFLQHARDAVGRADAAVDAVHELIGLRAGSIRVGGGATAITYLLPSVVSRLRREHPALRFYVREAGSSAVAGAVRSGELDLGVVTLPITIPGKADIQEIPLLDDELRLIVPPGHALATRRTFRFADLADEPFVAFEAGSAVRDLIDRAAGRAGVPLHVVMELRSIESIKSMVDAGVGVGLVSRLALSPGEGLPCRDEPLTRRLAIIRRQGRIPSPAAAAFEELLLASARKR